MILEKLVRDLPQGKWAEDGYGGWVVRGKAAYFFLKPRPHYCNRGDWTAHVESLDISQMPKNWSRGWPQYYFGTDVAKSQVERWLKSVGQLDEGAENAGEC